MLKSAAASFKKALFPDKCAACGILFQAPSPARDLRQRTRRAVDILSPYICPDCIRDLVLIQQPWCVKCGIPFSEAPGNDHLCGDCLLTPGKIRQIRSAGLYEATLPKLIRGFKFNRKLYLASPLGRLMFDLFTDSYRSQETPHNEYPDLILPVPLHRSRIKERKYNQSWLLIRGWKKFAVQDGFILSSVIRHDLLVRQKQTIPQTGLDRKARKTNIKGAFSVPSPESVAGKKVLLTDDVYTTGATVEECTRSLLKAGARQVDVLTLARRLDP